MALIFGIVKKAVGIFAAFIAVVALIIIVFLCWFTRDMCGNYEISSTPIPETEYKIVVFQRDCGATTGFSTQASIIKKTAQLRNEGGNIFSADDNHGAAPAGPGGGPELRVSILGPGSIGLSYHEKARVFRSKQFLRGVSIKYSTHSHS